MKPMALIIEDDPSIRAALADRLESFGHDCEAIGSQLEARERIERRGFAYILLDVELPVRFGRPPSIETGKNILRDIRKSAHNKKTPVLVVTAHGHDCPDLAVEMWRKGANHFIKKPFTNLEQAIHEVLSGDVRETPDDAGPGDDKTLRKLANATITYFSDRIELDGIEICVPDNGTIWRMLNLLKERKANGQPKAFSAKLISEALGLLRGQNAVCDAVSAFRKRVIGILAAHGIEADDDSMIIRGRPGYQLHHDLTIHDQSDQPAAKIPAETCDSPAHRQEWFLEEIRAGRKLRRSDLEKQFGISTATAKRDLACLEDMISFVGVGKKGHYELAG